MPRPDGIGVAGTPRRPHAPVVWLLPAVVLPAAALVGWFTRIDAFFTLGTAVAMQPNTALGLLWCACALWLPDRYRRTAVAAGGAAGALGLLTLAQYATGVSLGIDTLLFTPHVPGPNGAPGRMAWQTALNLTALGIGGVALRMPIPDASRSAAAGVAAALVLAVTTFVVSGGVFVSGGLLNWGAWTSVALGTAIAGGALAVALLQHAKAAHPQHLPMRWVPVAVLLAVWSTGGMLWHWLSSVEVAVLDSVVASAAAETAARLEEGKVQTEGALGRMARRWNRGAIMAGTDWNDDARAYVNDLGLVYLWHIGPDGATDVVGRDDGSSPTPRLTGQVRDACLALGRRAEDFARHAFWQQEDRPVGVSMARLTRGGAFDGCLATTVYWEEVLQRSLPRGAGLTTRAVVDGREVARAGDASPAVGRFARGELASDRMLFVEAAPTAALAARHRDWTAELALATFVVFGLLAGFGVRESQAATERQAVLLAAATAAAEARQQAAVVLENSGQGFWDWNVVTGQVTLDATWHTLMGYSPGEIDDGFAVWKAGIHDDDVARVLATLDRHLQSDDTPYDIDYRARRKDGSWTWINTRGRVQARDKGGRALRMMGTIQDVSERKRVEQATLESLREKETLLREIHHRVKNNLAVISSLFYFQAQEARDPAVVAALRDSQDRTRSMAMVHELLYRSNDLSRIAFDEYLRQLVMHLRESHGAPLPPRLDLSPLQLDVETAVPCGLIVTELVTNVFKHAYPAGGIGPIGINLTVSNGRVRLTVADEGVGLPPGLNPDAGGGLGLRVIRALAIQLDGQVVFNRLDTGTEACLEFPLGDANGSDRIETLHATDRARA